MTRQNHFLDLGPKWHCPNAGRYAFTFISLLIFLIIIYGNSFRCQWHFDDFPNIVDNANVHLKTLSWKDIKRAFYGMDDGRENIVRPLSYLSFALNYYANRTRVFGYHLVNFMIHYTTSVFVFLLIYTTLKLPLLKNKYKGKAYAIALLTVFFWSTHPIQVTAVTYIVQRMTSMAAMFYVMAMYFYVRGRTTGAVTKKAAFFTLCGLTAGLAFASKQNAAMLPMSLFLYDLLLITGVTRHTLKRGLTWGVLPILMILLLALIYVDFSSVLGPYQDRPFTPMERLLTEARILVFYISLLAYPTSGRLSLLHHVGISSSLLTPWTTWASLLIILFILSMALWALKKRPLIAYCIAFFFLNHLIEGSILPLELIFEHRNYLPSVFLFVLPSLLAVHVLDYFSYNKSLQAGVCAVITVIWVAHGHTTYFRNQILRTEVSLWRDVVKKAPALSRPYINLSNALFRDGQTAEAADLLHKAAHTAPGPHPRSRALPAHNLGHYYLAVGEIDRAMALFRDALRIDPSMAHAYHGIAKALFFQGRLDDAEKNIREAISMKPNAALFQRTLSVILLRAGRVNAAMKAALHGRQLDQALPEPLYILGEAYRMKRRWKKAAFYFEEFIRLRPQSLYTRLALIEIYGQMGDMPRAKHHAFALMANKGHQGIGDVLSDFDSQINFMDSTRVNTILDILRECLESEAQRLKEMPYPPVQRQQNKQGRQPLIQRPKALPLIQP